jgi:hypothetical protein
VDERMQIQNAVNQAIADKDYAAYKTAAENLINSQKIISEDEFNAMAERYNSTESGKGFGPMEGFGHMYGFDRHHMHW